MKDALFDALKGYIGMIRENEFISVLVTLECKGKGGNTAEDVFPILKKEMIEVYIPK